jgi:NAD(P)-dependent dehydrogenase (short-subunit alcohol dehydrogenase family)
MTIELTTQRFAGKVALVTGAASGIGAATARRLFAEGAQLVLVDLDPAGLDAVREETKAQVVVGDAAEGATLEQAVALAKSAYGRLDVLVTAAGFETVGGAEHVDFEAWRKVLSINLDGALLASRAALPLMRESGDGGAIVLLSSIGGLVGSAQNAAYATAKAGLLGLNRSIAIDNGPHGIRCNAIAPGLCHSKLTERMFGAFSQISGLTSEDVQSRLTKPLPLGRIAQPEEIAGIIAFLASHEASFITGTVLAADGGATAVEVSLANIF